MAVPCRQPARRAARLVLHQFRHLVADGVEVPEPVVTDQCLKLEFHERRRRRRHHAAVEEHLRAVARARMPAALEPRGQQLQLGRSDSSGGRRRARSGPVIEVDEPCFAAPGDMPEAIRNILPPHRTASAGIAGRGDPLRPGRVGQKKIAVSWLAGRIGRRADRNDPRRRRRHAKPAACQMTADACGRRVVAGADRSHGDRQRNDASRRRRAVSTIAEASEVIRRSFAVEEYTPRDSAAWNQTYERYLALSR